MLNQARWMREAILLIITLAVAIFISDHVVGIVSSGGGSMAPTLQLGDKLLVDKFTFRLGLRPLQIGDIIGFRYQGRRFIKRIIAVGGQRVQIAYCYVFVNGKPLIDDTFNHPHHPNPQRRCYYNAGQMSANTEVLVPQGHYFVLGDNSSDSWDSRYEQIGFIRHEDVLERLFLRIWPPWRFGVP